MNKEIRLPLSLVAILFIVALDYNLIYYVVLGIIAGMLYSVIREKLGTKTNDNEE
jgi:hypothetical protein